jgi:hypothetical protein
MSDPIPNAAASSTKPDDTSYTVQPPEAYTAQAPATVEAERSAALASTRAPKFAVFVAHGMGQQIDFQTLDQVAKGLRLEDAERRGVPLTALPVAVARTVEVDGERTRRIELRLRTAHGAEQEVHIYEGYWASLTEGQVKLRDVVTFIFGAGYNGLRLAGRPFRRWLFGGYHEFPTPVRTPVYLVLALAVVAALVVMNIVVVIVAAARSPLTKPPTWLSNELFADLTTTFNLWLTFVIASLIALLLVKAARWAKAYRPVRLAASWLSALFLYLTLAATVSAGVALPLLFYGHVSWTKSAELSNSARPEFLRRAFSARFVYVFNYWFELVVFWLFVGVAAISLVLFVAKLVADVLREVSAGKSDSWVSVVVVLLFIGLLAAAPMAVFVLRGEGTTATSEQPLLTLRRGLSWLLLILVSAYVRSLLIKYVGDVAAYIAPYRLDRFTELRDKIKQCVVKRMRAVYAARGPHGNNLEYDQVFVVGHSLGAVVIYDALNQLINDDLTALSRLISDDLTGAKSPLDVLKRTRLLLTFGAPLNKVAFLFRLQGTQTSEAREALAAAVQPLIQDYRYRPFPWINIYSRWDIISGWLDYYDPPNGNDPHRIDNQRDEDASTLLVAHVEYWKNRKLFKTLHDKLTSRSAGG